MMTNNKKIENKESKDNDKDKDKDNDKDKLLLPSEEAEIWTLISSDFSTLRAPTLQINQEEQNDDDQYDVNKEDESHNDDNNVYLYHLTNVLPGLI